jgi:N-acetyl-beta-hexosaminidase
MQNVGQALTRPSRTLLTAAVALLAVNVQPDFRPLLIPKPKAVRWDRSSVDLSNSTTICIGTDPLHKTAAKVIAREIVALGGPVPKIQTTLLKGDNVIALGEPASMPWLQSRSEVPQNSEGYWLTVDSGLHQKPRIIICGRTPQGTLHGAQTLAQLISKQGSRIVAKGAKVRDYPSLSWRGAHLFLGNTALPFHKKLIANTLARFKMNQLVLQCEQARWDALGNLAPEWAMSKADLRAELEYAREFGFGVTPLVSSVTHMRWLLKNDKYGDLAEDPREKVQFNISPGDPRTYEILFGIYDEVVEVFKPEALHVGADEITYGGRYPFRSKARYSKMSEAFVDHLKRLHGYLKEKDVKMMIWADMLMTKGEFKNSANSPSKEETQAIRKGLPKDILLIDWHYSNKNTLERVISLEKAGFGKIIGAGWKVPQAIQLYSKVLSDREHLGFLETTWVGYESSEKNLETYPDSFSAFLVAAEHAWNGGTSEKLHFNPLPQFQRAYGLPLP